MEGKDDLQSNINKIHTTTLGAERIKRNLKLGDRDAVAYCKAIISDKESSIYRRGKNWYCTKDKIVITINSFSYTIITAHKQKK
ncbi:MAG: DUF3781 domain-containing protein [Bacteroidaceae bacterium]|nr:DUF3781 domain-containing protein [Bacteroidaceae bacterium]